MNRPTTNDATTGGGSIAATPASAGMIDLLGSPMRYASVALSSDEWRAIQRLYRYTREAPHVRPPEPVDPGAQASWQDKQAYKSKMDAWRGWEDPMPLMQAGADNNALRHAACDGMRLLAWLARHVEPGKDPVQELVRLAVDAGWDVDPCDVEWAQGDDVESMATEEA